MRFVLPSKAQSLIQVAAQIKSPEFFEDQWHRQCGVVANTVGKSRMKCLMLCFLFLKLLLIFYIQDSLFLGYDQASLVPRLPVWCCCSAFAVSITIDPGRVQGHVRVYISAKASSTESVEREHGQKVPSCLSQLLQRCCKETIGWSFCQQPDKHTPDWQLWL